MRARSYFEAFETSLHKALNEINILWVAPPPIEFEIRVTPLAFSSSRPRSRELARILDNEAAFVRARSHSGHRGGVRASPLAFWTVGWSSRAPARILGIGAAFVRARSHSEAFETSFYKMLSKNQYSMGGPAPHRI